MNTPDWLHTPPKRQRRRRKGCRRRIAGCLLFLTVGFILLLALLVWLVTPVKAAPHDSLAVWLVMDNSNSMFADDGPGSDPHLLRLDAARLFISYLGIDSQEIVHQCGVIFFGTEAEIVVPLTPLTDALERTALLAPITHPSPMGWTDQVAALTLAYQQAQLNENGQPVIVLLTDGQPEWGNSPTEAEQVTYLAELEAIGKQLHAAAIPLFIILLRNEAVPLNPAIAQTWQPVWERMTAATPVGRFYTAHRPEDLMAIYHDTVVALTGDQTAGAVWQETVNLSIEEQLVAVEPNLQHMKWVISKSHPDVEVTIWLPNGQPLTPAIAGVRYAGTAGVSREEIWSITTPLAGLWRVQIAGSGQVTLWKDYQVIPVLPAETSTTPVITPTTNHQSTLLPTLTPLSSPPVASTATPMTATQVTIVSGRDSLPVRDGSPLRQPQTTDWLWGIPLGILLVLFSYWLRQKWVSHPLTVTGTIRVLAGPDAAAPPTLFELDNLNRREITFGPGPADIPLPGATGTIVLHAGPALVGSDTVFIRGSGRVFINNESLTSSQPLTDSTIIAIGMVPDVVYRLRYENLRLRAFPREAVLADW